MYYIKQMFDNDCGFAALKNLLANLFKNEKYLYIKQNENHGPYSYLHLVKEAEKYGVELEGIELDNEKLSVWNEFPIIVTIKNANGNPHAVVINNRNKNKIQILDSDIGDYWMDINKFIEIWDKTILHVKAHNEIDFYSKSKDLNLDLKQKTFLYIFQLLSSLCLIFSVLFLDKEQNIIYSLVFGLGFLASEIIFRIILWNMLKSVSYRVVGGLKDNPKSPYDLLYRLEMYKKSLLTSGVTTLFNGIMGFFLVVVTILNGRWNFIMVLTIIAMAILNTLVAEPIYKKLEKNVEIEEKSISNSKSCFDFKKRYEKITDSTAKFAKKRIVKTLTEIAIIYVVVMIVTKLNNELNTISVLFYMTICYYLFSSLNKLFDYKDKKIELMMLKAKLCNLLN